ncbi:MAG TPA: phosphoenolpyruvate synthase [Puia sp.]|uniref:phosphoenolpyruvate synthase n=1 Tax=Puia sp. TaxID=2045100 RepID=UPI002C160518|nr:phosphoenolpyruvate synthase [Puia sp.]HVU94210.1 phosphoenolpyruvate synthase [Puia sp.]
MPTYIKSFAETGIKDIPAVGGKNASLGEMLTALSSKGIRVPDGFATTAEAFRYFLSFNELPEKLAALMERLDRVSYSNLAEIGGSARQLIYCADMPDDLGLAIGNAYARLCPADEHLVAVRSSATAEDLPNASFAGQHESFLFVSGEAAVVDAVQMCFASLYTDRAIKYREDNGFAHASVALSAGVQRMVDTDKGSSGVIFTLEPESGFRDVLHIAGIWGLGENLVQGAATPDEWLVFKPMLGKAKDPVIRRTLGAKQMTMVRGNLTRNTVNVETPAALRDRYVLEDSELLRLSEWALLIEKHYGQPMDIEWAKDGVSGELYILQARPETVQSRRDPRMLTSYSVVSKGKRLASGEAVGKKIVAGKARIMSHPGEAGRLEPGEIIVTDSTSPDWDPVLKKAAAIVTNKGGRTSHASIVARELGVPAVVGTGNATSCVSDGDVITVSCCEGGTGSIYEGKAEWKETTTDLRNIAMPAVVKPMLIVGDPDQAFELSYYPNGGVGLMRMEFIITNFIGVHPMACADFASLPAGPVRDKISALTRGYADKRQYFIDRLAQGVATIAAAFYPKEVILRTSDFKSNEYAGLPGGAGFEPKEENPMLGFRGASRYYSPLYKEGFRLECAAIRKVREEMGLTNLKVMIPFCRTVEEGEKVIAEMAEFGLNRGEHGLKVYMMAEIPSNVLLAEDFARIFDGFSIGSNDLTQLTLGIDRDSTLVAGLFNEKNKAVLQLIAEVIHAARAAGVKIGLCGQAPSDDPGFARFLVREGIDTISFNADALLKGIENILEAEKSVHADMIL